jgi:signal peptidase I
MFLTPTRNGPPHDERATALTTTDTSTDTTEEEGEGQSVLSHLGSFAREFFFIVVGAIIVSTLLRMFVGQMFMIPSASMQDTLMIGDRIVAQKISDPQRGDVVVFGDPGGWLRNARPATRGPAGHALQFIGVLPDLTKGDLVKRVIGLPGDKVECCDRSGRITVNGQALDETSYLSKDPGGVQVKPSEVAFSVVVPEGHLFVLGDNRPESADSRCHLSDVWQNQPKGAVAFVPITSVVGPAFAVVLPFNHAKRLPRPDTFATLPAAAQAAPAVASISPANVIC